MKKYEFPPQTKMSIHAPGICWCLALISWIHLKMITRPDRLIDTIAIYIGSESSPSTWLEYILLDRWNNGDRLDYKHFSSLLNMKIVSFLNIQGVWLLISSTRILNSVDTISKLFFSTSLFFTIYNICTLVRQRYRPDNNIKRKFIKNWIFLCMR